MGVPHASLSYHLKIFIYDQILIKSDIQPLYTCATIKLIVKIEFFASVGQQRPPHQNLKIFVYD